VIHCYRHFCWQCMCVVCVCDGGEGETKEPCGITLRTRPVRWVSLRLCTVYTASLIFIPTLACTRGPGALKPGSSGLSQI